MVAGATGIDLVLLVVAADDGVMPQTVEHVAVLRALGLGEGVVALTKADLADPARAREEVEALLGEDLCLEAVACSARTGEGSRTSAPRSSAPRAGSTAAGAAPAPARRRRRCCTSTGPSPSAARGRSSRGRCGRARSGAATCSSSSPPAGGRACGACRSTTSRSSAPRPGSGSPRTSRASSATRSAAGTSWPPRRRVAPTLRLDAALALRGAAHGSRVHVHHGTREAPPGSPTSATGSGSCGSSARCWPGPATTSSSGRCRPRTRSGAGGPGRRRPPARPPRRRAGPAAGAAARGDAPGRDARASDAATPAPEAPAAAPAPLPGAARALEARLRRAGHEPPLRADLGPEAEHLDALRDAGRAVRVGRDRWAHPEAVAAVRARVEALVAADGSVTLAALRDDLGTSRQFAQALLEHLDAARVTVRRPDDTRVLRRRAG